jgi:hypothetical protein
MILLDLRGASWTLRWKEEEARLRGSQTGELLAVLAPRHLADALEQSETQAQVGTRELEQRTGDWAACRGQTTMIHLGAWMAEVDRVLAARAWHRGVFALHAQQPRPRFGDQEHSSRFGSRIA